MAEDSNSNQATNPAENVLTSSGKLVDYNSMGDPDAVVRGFAEEKNPPSVEIPEKFKGKSLEDVVKSYQELEKASGRQAQELGELRRLQEAYMKSQIERAGKDSTSSWEPADRRMAEVEADSVDWDDPDVKRTKELLSKELGPLQAELAELRKEKFLTKLNRDHSDFQEIVSDKEFQDWVMNSPVRVEMYKQADINFDYESANELFSIWKERTGREKAKTQEAAQKEETTEQYEQARMETTSTDTGTPKRTYRRADIRELMQRDPERYRALEPEIAKAYLENRVV